MLAQLRLIKNNEVAHYLLHCLLVPSAHNLCKQVGPRSGPTKCRARSGSNLFDTQMVFLNEFFEKNDFEKFSRRRKSMKNFPGSKELKLIKNKELILQATQDPMAKMQHPNSCYLTYRYLKKLCSPKMTHLN